jgi:tetratricopeptide (TPR) repeat protein
VLLIFSGCASTTINQKRPLKKHLQKYDWYNADISTLPIAKDPGTLARFAYELSNWSSPYGQKIYSLRLSLYALNQEKKNRDIALIVSRSAFMVADATDNEDEMKKHAEIGVKAGKIAGAKKGNPEASYYYALNLGLIVRTKGLLGIGKLSDIADALKTAQAKPDLDMGGPLRVLGMLYLKAPEFPTGIGDLEKSLSLLKESVDKYPVHPLNFIFYAEALIEDDEKEEARTYLDRADRFAVPEIWGDYYSKKWRSMIKILRSKLDN